MGIESELEEDIQKELIRRIKKYTRSTLIGRSYSINEDEDIEAFVEWYFVEMPSKLGIRWTMQSVED